MSERRRDGGRESRMEGLRREGGRERRRGGEKKRGKEGKATTSISTTTDMYIYIQKSKTTCGLGAGHNAGLPTQVSCPDNSTHTHPHLA